MMYPQIELWLYDTQRELDRDALEGKVCPWSAVHGLVPHCPVRIPPWKMHSQPDYALEALKAVISANSQAGIPTQIPCSPMELSDIADPLLLAATWPALPSLLGSPNASHKDWTDWPLTLHYHGFSGPILSRQIPRFPAHFPAQPYPLLTMLKQSLRSRRQPLSRQSHPFPIDAFWRDLFSGQEGVWQSDEYSDQLGILRGWKLCSCLPNRGVFSGDRLWDAPLQYRYPATWVIERRASLCDPIAYTAFLGEKHPGWPDLLYHAIRDLPKGVYRWVLVLEDSSPNIAERAAFGRCLCFVVDDKEHCITITRNDDAREAFCHALEEYTRTLDIPAADFPF